MVDINKSILNKNNFRLLIDKVPTVEYYVQSVNIPGVQFTEIVSEAGVGLDVYWPGDKVTFDTLSVTFLVDEDLENYKEVYDWINSIVPISDPAAYSTYTGAGQNVRGISDQAEDNLKTMSQITLVTNTNKNLPNRYFHFHDAFPISLGALELQSGSETEPVTCTCEFRFTYYEIKSTS